MVTLRHLPCIELMIKRLLLGLMSTMAFSIYSHAAQPFYPQGIYKIRYLDNKPTYKSVRWVKLEVIPQGLKRSFSNDEGVSWVEDGDLQCFSISKMPPGLFENTALAIGTHVTGIRCQYIGAPDIFRGTYYWFLNVLPGTKMYYQAPSWTDDESKAGLVDESIENPEKIIAAATTEFLIHVIEQQGTPFPYIAEQLRPRD